MEPPAKPVERLFPFVLRSRILVVGRESLRRQRKRLEFLLVTTDLSDNSLREVRKDFADTPVFLRYTSAELDALFGLQRTKLIGLRKSSLASAVARELAAFRITTPDTTSSVIVTRRILRDPRPKPPKDARG